MNDRNPRRMLVIPLVVVLLTTAVSLLTSDPTIGLICLAALIVTIGWLVSSWYRINLPANK